MLKLYHVLLIMLLLKTEKFTGTIAYSDSPKYHQNITELLDRLMDGYDKGTRPTHYSNKPTVIIVGMWILSIDAIDVVDMEYRVDIFFRQEWLDARLAHSFPGLLTVHSSMLNKIWVPDTYFLNSKTSNFHHVTLPNKMLRIAHDGTVSYNCRITLKASCPMNLIDFPVDTQNCQLHIESYGYSERHIVYRWEENNKTRVSIDQEKTLPQFNLTAIETWRSRSSYVSGNWSSLMVGFTLRRQGGHFLLHLYAPCVLVVSLSWIAFFIPRDSVAARISLGITSVLTTTTIMNIQNNSMPKVSYIKLADWYLIVCFLFVFGTLIEFTVILYLSGRERRRQRKESNLQAKEALYAEKTKHPFPETESFCTGGDLSESFVAERRQRYDKNLKEEDTKRVQMVLGDSTFEAFALEHIDEYARILFPLSFIIFNIIYWIHFLKKKSQIHHHE